MAVESQLYGTTRIISTDAVSAEESNKLVLKGPQHSGTNSNTMTLPQQQADDATKPHQSNTTETETQTTTTTSPKQQQQPASLYQYAHIILTTAPIKRKQYLTFQAYHRFKKGDLPIFIGTTGGVGSDDDTQLQIPLHPERPTDLTVVAPSQVKRRGTGSLHGRQAFIHSLCHMEAYAIDISWDIIARYIEWQKDAYMERYQQQHQHDDNVMMNRKEVIQQHLEKNHGLLPREFFQDWLQVAQDEAKHFGWLNDHLKHMGLSEGYGSLPVHTGLWESCVTTADSLLARLVILHCLHEARGNDIMPTRIKKMENAKDFESAELLKLIVKDEITHVRYGVRWFQYLCEEVYQIDCTETFHAIVDEYFRGTLKPPFNVEARDEAGMPHAWYQDYEKHRQELKNREAQQQEESKKE